MCVPCDKQDLSNSTIIFDFVTLTLTLNLLLKNFNIGCYLVMVAARRASLSSDNSYYCPNREQSWGYMYVKITLSV